MGQDEKSGEFQSLNRAVQEAWNRIAPWWDDRVGAEGNDFHQVLVAPATERLLALKPDEVVLDIACGNRQFSRRMADLGARVVAFDFSEAFIDRAKARTQEHAGRIEYLVLDATDRARFLSLGPRRFDAAICTMALMDMAAIEPLVSTLRMLLKPGGRFVFSVMHPCFNSMGSRMVIEEGYQDGNLALRSEGCGVSSPVGQTGDWDRGAACHAILLSPSTQHALHAVLRGRVCVDWHRGTGVPARGGAQRDAVVEKLPADSAGPGCTDALASHFLTLLAGIERAISTLPRVRAPCSGGV